MDYREKARQIHESVNHTYGGHPYILHLDATAATGREFFDDLFKSLKKFDTQFMSMEENDILVGDSLWKALYFHDTEEDCRLTHNDIKKLIGETAANIVHAVTNHKGKTRAERANSQYYKEIRETTGASFVKMCDRIANVRFSRMMGSGMFEKYREENAEFMRKVDAKRFPTMRKCLINLFK